MTTTSLQQAGSGQLRCVVVGEQSLLVQCGEILLREGHHVAAVVTGDAGIARWARVHGLRVIASLGELAGQLASEPFDYLFSITNLAIVPDEVLALPRRAAINFHDGPLPRYAGLNAPAWALMRGETGYGVTFHEMRAEIDEGAILVQRRFEISPDETSLSLNTKCFEAGIGAFAELVARLAGGTAQPIPQDLAQKSYFGKYDRPADCAFLDFARTAREIDALVRALDFGDRYENPLGVAKIACAGRPVVVLGSRVAEVAESGAAAAPGTVLAVDGQGATVVCGEGAVRLDRFASVFGEALGVAELGLREGQVLESVRVADALSDRLARSEVFWLRRLARLDPLALPSFGSGRGGRASAGFAGREVASPDGIGDADRVAGAVAACLGRLSGQERFHVAFRDAGLRALVGEVAWLSPSVPVRVEQTPDASVRGYFEAWARELARVRGRGTWLQDAIGRTPGLARDPRLSKGGLTDVCIEIGDLAAPLAPRPGTELVFRVAEDGRRVRFESAPGGLDERGARALESHLAVYLASLAAARPDDRMCTLSLLSPGERDRVLRAWNDTAVGYEKDRCVHELFAEQASRTPDATAVVFEDAACSYRELDARANRLANHLRAKGVGPDRLVGIYVDRSLDMLVAMLGVLKAGGAYVPLDPAYPAERIALMIEDSGAGVVITQGQRAAQLPGSGADLVRLDADWPAIGRHPATCPDSGVTPSHLAYVIYTSGSTGRPKGVMVEHRNVVNFFAGMDARVPHDPPGSWLAVTSLSFDISVLELLWTLARGFKVVVYADSARQAGAASSRPMDFGLFMWGADDAQGNQKYELMLESAVFGDSHGFSSFWTPERHFHAFGGPYPNPSVTSAAIAAVTERIAIRAGSCVSPLHHPIRIAEEWAVVDNLSKGRVGISFASGWQPNDFVIRPESHGDAKAQMYRDLETVRRLWRGEAVEFTNPMGKSVPTRTQPRPVQPELPFWVTTAGNPESFRQAGQAGANLLTHLLGQTVEELGAKIALYRRGRKDAGHDPDAGIVTLMLHTLVGEDDESVKAVAAEPMKSYLRSSAALLKGFAWAFPAFTRPGGSDGVLPEIDFDGLREDELNAILDFAFERYFETSGLFGSVETCLAQVERVKAIGVDEIGCLIDYGVPTHVMLESLKLLDQVRERANARAVGARGDSLRRDQSLPAQVLRHGVTHMQCTPSMARMLVLDRDAHPALARIQHLLIGGEAFPLSLAHDLAGLPHGNVTNMYGPTETTIWSSTAPVAGRPEQIPIGRPIANTCFYVLDANREPVPVGVDGELWIGGDGVVRGYHRREELSAERFVPDPFRRGGARMYRTGDLARWEPDGSVSFRGRIDQQVKIRGYRIELGEVEARLAQHPGVEACVAQVREDAPGDQRLVAYAVASSAAPEPTALRAFLAESLPEFMLPSAFCFLDALPLTPNGKIDRKALPAPEQLGPRSAAAYEAPESDLEKTIASVWREVLQVESVGTGDNFFDLGGHSLLVVQVHRQLRERVPLPLSLTDLYRFPTIRSLVAHLESGGGPAAAATQGEDRGERRKAALARRRRRSVRG